MPDEVLSMARSSPQHSIAISGSGLAVVRAWFVETFEASALFRIRPLPAGALDEASASGASCPSEVPLP